MAVPLLPEDGARGSGDSTVPIAWTQTTDDAIEQTVGSMSNNIDYWTRAEGLESDPQDSETQPPGMVHAWVGQIVTNSVSARFLAVATRL